MYPLNLRPPLWIYWLFLAGAFALILRFLLDSGFGNSAVVYVAIPFVVSIAIHQLIGRFQDGSLLTQFLNHFRDATVVFLATSAFLFEGFICVLFFMPIYYGLMVVAFIFVSVDRAIVARKGRRIGAYAVPAVVLMLSLEGVAPTTTLPRDASVTRSIVVSSSIETLKHNMARPIALPRDRHWFLSIFPLPVAVKAGTLATGDVHEIDFVYRRWFFTNVHKGRMRLALDHVGETRIRTRVLENTSYLSTYMKIEGTEVVFTPLGNGKTGVTLTLHYKRLLDPAWYFGPLQRYAAGLSAEYLIRSVILREGRDV